MGRDVLVVDDARDIADLLTHILEGEGYDVRVAEDGFAAWAEVERARPDLVITDEMHPGPDGIALARILHGMDISVILASGFGTGPQLAGVRFLAKPFDLDELLAVVAAEVRAKE